MRSTDQILFAAILRATLCGLYRQPEPLPEVVALWWEALHECELDDVRRALSLHVRDPDRGQYPPRPADVSRHIEGSTQTQGMRAWVKVERALRSVGGYQSVAFDDPLIHAVLSEMGDWPSLCQTPVNELPFRAREFERRYAGYRAQRIQPDYPPHLIGRLESDRRSGGHDVNPPVLIGDPAKAMDVVEQAKGRPGVRITGPGRGMTRIAGGSNAQE